MSPLPNRRHEAFAQALAQGLSPETAYAAAGYAGGHRNGARLRGTAAIAARVMELTPSPPPAAEVATRLEPPALSLARLTEDLLRLAEKNEALESAAGYSAARAALMDAARLNGLLVERAEADLSLRLISDRPLTAEEWSALHVPMETALTQAALGQSPKAPPRAEDGDDEEADI